MNWKKVTFGVLLAVVVVVVLTLGGYAIYRTGYQQGVAANTMHPFGRQMMPGDDFHPGFGRGNEGLPGNRQFGGQMPFYNNRVLAARNPSLLPALGLLVLGAGAVGGLVGVLAMRNSKSSSEAEMVEAAAEPEEPEKPSRGRRKKEE